MMMMMIIVTLKSSVKRERRQRISQMEVFINSGQPLDNYFHHGHHYQHHPSEHGHHHHYNINLRRPLDLTSKYEQFLSDKVKPVLYLTSSEPHPCPDYHHQPCSIIIMTSVNYVMEYPPSARFYHPLHNV